MYPSGGSYYLEPDGLHAFLKEYCDAIYENAVGVGIAEKIMSASPIIADIDLRRPIKGNEGDELPLYTSTDLRNVISAYITLFDNILPQLDTYKYVCIVLEKQSRIENGSVKHGFHLQFPYICLTVNDIKNHVLPVIEEKVNHIFGKGAFDNCVVSNPWLLYGSRKGSDKEPYVVTRCFNRHLDLITPEEAFENFKLYNPIGYLIHRDKPLAYYYPYFLTTNCQFREILTVLVDEMDSSLVSLITSTHYHANKKVNYQMMSSDEYASNLEKAKLFIPLLSDMRATERNSWWKVGRALFNACGPGHESLELWIEFSRRTTENNFSRQGCIDEWNKMEAGGVSLGTICHFAREDNPTKYAEITYDTNRQDICAALNNGSHYDLACLLYKEYKDVFRCTSIGKKRWYQFDVHGWKKIESGTALRTRISTQLLEHFKTYRRKMVIERGVLQGNEQDTKDLDKKITGVDKIIFNLKTSTFKNNVMCECQDLFYDEYFESRLDNDPYLIAFKNGVYDLRTHTFRDGVPSDYITKSMPIDYEVYDHYHPDVQSVYKFLSQIFPDKSIREYFIKISSRIFKGGNNDKKAPVWTGEGNGGKSVTAMLFEKMLGPYAQKPPTSVLTGARVQGGSADPALARTQGVRWLVFQEPSEKDHINCGVLKELTGNDTFYARDLYQAGSEVREITPMFKIALLCNKLPNILDADQAIWNRVRIIPFESTFVEPADLPTTEEEQLLEKKFPMDPNFSDKIPSMLKAFAWMLLDMYKQTEGTVIEEPLKVRMATNAYRSRNDIVRQYLDEFVEECRMAVITVSELYASFKAWYTENGYSARDCMTRRDYQERISKCWGEPDNRGRWIGYRFVQAEFEDDVVEK